MSAILLATLVIGALAAGLALLLVVADALLLNYGDCRLKINGEEEKTVPGGGSLLSGLKDEGIFIPSACGGRGSCGLCKLKVKAGAGPLLPTETPHLTKEEIAQSIRLCCQVKIRNDLELEIPPEILSLKEYPVKVEKLVALNYDTRLLRLAVQDGAEVPFRPGQYLQWETPAYGQTPEPVYRAYSIASPPGDKRHLELIVRRVPGGIATTYIFEVLREGQAGRINGPYGEFYLRDSGREILFIAGGSGIAPIRSILFQMAAEKIQRRATFFYGANERRDLYLVEEMREFEKKLADFRYVPALGRPAENDEWDGETGLVTAVLARQVSDASQMEAYLCGAPGMIDATIKTLAGLGLPEERIYYDKFA